ncbi:glycosyltransferase, partial [Alphaproteobacteria bacterium]|nr:glycosyltransferase [Alphaproteobacteria bacterium]
FVDLFDMPCSIHNVTDGKNLYLNVKTKSGKFIIDEGDIVDNTEKEEFKEIFFTKEKINKKLNSSQIKSSLKKLTKLPNINKKILEVLENSSIIVFGPGTQFSSLFPTYKTQKLNQCLSNLNAIKLLILNLETDNDIYGKSGSEVLELILEHLSHKKLGDNVDLILVDQDYSKKFINLEKLRTTVSKKIMQTHCSLNGTVHDRDLVVSSIINSAKSLQPKIIEPLIKFCSIIVPTLNEGTRLFNTLDKISNSKKIANLEIRFEIIVVDGANEESIKNKVLNYGPQFRYISGNSKYRGLSLRKGIESARGDLIAIFPSDLEYSVDDLSFLIKNFINSNFEFINGNRSNNLNSNRSGMFKRSFVSKIGGALAGFLLYIKHNIQVSDLLSTMKVFKKSSLLNQKFKAQCIDFDAELLITIFRNGGTIVEFPVSYFARSYKQGKKTTVFKGINLLKYIFVKG